MSSPPQKSKAEQLTCEVQYIKGVGPRRAELLQRLDLTTARDILFFFPRTYQDMSQLCPIDQLEEGESVSVCGTVEETDLRGTGPGKSVLGVLIRQNDAHLRAIWFNQAFLQRRFRRGGRVLLSGEPHFRGGRWEMTHPRIEILGDEEAPPAGKILPVYPLTEGVSQSQMRRIVQGVVEDLAPALEEVFPEEFLDRHSLWPIQTALPQIHGPASQECLEEARRRFIYQELLVLQLALAMRRWKLIHQQNAAQLPASEKINSRIFSLFSFQLTKSQRKVIKEIAEDMQRPYPMNRLLQGDVGSGKTVAAIYAMLLAVAHGRQAVLMAPTEVLASQHFKTLQTQLEKSRVRIGVLTGSLTAKQRKTILEEIAAGEIDLVIGTQAIVQKSVKFARLGLVVIDEQHKFGVQQRWALKGAQLSKDGLSPHYLVMTATPIPRTLTMTLFGDLDVSTLSDPPPGRQEVHTYLADQEQRSRWWDFFRKKLREGRQGFVVTPLVDESDALEVANVQQSFEALANGELAEFRVDIIHGRMSVVEKEAAMESFRRGETQVLIATSVIEVGVDVPNAVVMAIEGGERFGLAQLHQLRGRISRGTHPGFLCVFANPQTEESQQRLDAFCKTNDGFRLAEVDFQLRGPGDLFSSRQHGLPPLRIADLIRDAEIVEQARCDAKELIQADPELQQESYARLRRMVMVRYSQVLELGDVG